MIFTFNENENLAGVSDAEDIVMNKDPETADGIQNIAQEVEDNMQTAAMESLTYFEGREEAVKSFTESAEVQALVEARKMSKKTFVRLGKADDLTRREHMACLIIAREKGDPLFKQLQINRQKERKLRNAIFKRYINQARRVAKLSQKQHVKEMRKMSALPKITI